MSVPAPPGSDAFTITLSDASAHPLSTNSETVTIAAGQTTTAPPLVLGGIAATYSLTPATDAVTSAHVSSYGNGAAIVGNKAYTFTILPIDASGATIIGPGTPAVTLTSPSSAVTVAAVSGTPGAYSVQVAKYVATPVALGVASTGGASGTIPIETIEEFWFAEYGNAHGIITGTKFAGGALTVVSGDTFALNPGGRGYNYPDGLAVDHAGNVWVTDYYNTTLTSYTPGSTVPVATLATAPYPNGLATAPNGNLWCANDGGVGGIGMQEVNPATGSFVTNPLSAIVASYPFVAINGAGNVFVTSNGPNTVTNYSAGGTLQGSFTVAHGPYGLAVDAEGDLWIAQQSATTANAYDPITGAAIAGTTLSGITQMVSFAIDGVDNVWLLQSALVKEFTRAGQLEATFSGPIGPNPDYASFTIAP